MGLSVALHALAAVIWVGGMFFAYLIMRPAVANVIPAEQRPALWLATFSNFFPYVWGAIAVLLLTGYALIGGMAVVGWHIHVMHGLGLLMMLIFLHLYFAPYRRLKQAVEAGDHTEGNRRVGQMRLFVAINLLIGLVVVIIGAGGRYW